MIDWLSMVIPCAHVRSIDGGRVYSVSSDGEIQWSTVKRASVRGSYDGNLTIRTATHTEGQLTHVEVSGNPVKFFQGHNVWGSDDLHGLAVHAIEYLSALPELGMEPTQADRDSWRVGNIQLTRVDVTESFHLANLSEVLAWVRAAESSAVLPYRGRGQLKKGTTLYFGKNSRRWSLKLYPKGEEIRAKGHEQHMILDLPHALAWADRTLRAELLLRSMELKRLGLDFVKNWIPMDDLSSVVTSRLLLDRLGSMTMTTVSRLSSDVFESLKPSLRMAFLNWQSGVDLRGMLPPRTFYRYRAELLTHGIDLASVNPSEGSGVVPLMRVLEAVPASIPEWAHGTKLYWEPRRVA